MSIAAYSTEADTGPGRNRMHDGGRNEPMDQRESKMNRSMHHRRHHHHRPPPHLHHRDYEQETEAAAPYDLGMYGQILQEKHVRRNYDNPNTPRSDTRRNLSHHEPPHTHTAPIRKRFEQNLEMFDVSSSIAPPPL